MTSKHTESERRAAFRETVRAVAPDMVARGHTEESVRKTVARAATKKERDGTVKPDPDRPKLSPEEVMANAERRGEVGTVKVRRPIGERLSHKMEKATGNAAPRVGFSQRPGRVTHDPLIEGARQMLERRKK